MLISLIKLNKLIEARHLKTLVSLLFFILTSISAFSQDNMVKNAYHNITAHYNAYWIAHERMSEIESAIDDRYDWDFNRMLPVYAQFDTTTSKSLEDPLTDCIQKASIAIQRHPDSRWEDEAYILVGLARLYGSEFPEAIETFKYVNTHGTQEEVRNKALVHLMRTFIEAHEIENARAVSDYITKRKLNDETLKELSLVRGYFYQKTGRLPEMASELQIAMEYMSGDPRRARIAFTLGQALQTIGADSLAYIYYKDAVRHSKTYDMSFYSQLNMSQVSQANSKASDREIRKYFRKLLKDPKNEDYKGRILFELGAFNYKKGELSEAIANYRESIQENRSNPRLKSYTYLKLASIYYDDLRDYRLAKAYYDSTAAIYPKEEPEYDKIKTRSEVLTDFVTYYETIQTNDSLLFLSQLPRDTLYAWIDELIAREEQKTIAEAARKEKERKRAAIFETSEAPVSEYLIDINVENEGTWYFYNTSELSTGFSEFKTKWGSRPLEDNWRRSLKAGTSENVVNAATSEKSEKPGAGAGEEESAPVFDPEAEREALLSTIPFDENQKRDLLAEIETATYEIGKIYNFQLEEKDNAISTFEGFVTRFDSSRYLPEVLYQLFLLYKNRDSLRSVYYFDQLTHRFDTSIYAKLAINPDYLDDRDRENEAYKKIYVRAYDLYKSGQARLSQRLIDSALFSNPQNEYVDNLKLLTAMNYGQLEGVYKYQFELSNFIKTYGESDLVPYAQKLLKTSQDFQVNLYSSSRAKFIRNFDTKHYFILVYPFEQELSGTVPDAVEQLIKKENLSLVTGNIVLDEDHAVVLVNEFEDKASAESFLRLYKNKEDLSTNFVTARFYPMVITDENFQIFFETKDLESYLTFFAKYYEK